MPKFLWYFILFCIFFSGRAQAQQETLEKHIQQLQQTVQNRPLVVSGLKADEPHSMPLGIGGGKDVDKPMILIDDLTLYPDHAEFNAYAVLKLPGSNDPIYLATASPVKLTYNGGLTGTARMELVKERAIHLPGGGSSLFTVKGGKTFIEFDCSGFKQAGLGVEFQLPSSFVPADGGGGRVTGSFEAVFANLNNIIAGCTIQPFEIQGIPGFTFTIEDAVIDMDDYANAASMEFPRDYKATYLPGVDPALWRGFYIRKASVKLPEELKDRSVTGRREIGVRNMLIDAQGFSGDIFGKNLISIQNGDLGGWDYSVDSLTVGITANQLKFAKLRGGVVIPTSDQPAKLAYSCLFNPGKAEYLFNVETASTLNFKLFDVAAVTLKPGSLVEVALENKKFVAQARLNGEMLIGSSLSGKNSSQGGNQGSSDNAFGASVKFEQLVLSTKAPFILGGTFDGGAEVKLGNFKASISNVGLSKDNDKRGFHFDLKVNVMCSGDANNGFAADASLIIWGKVSKDQQERQHYQYVSTEFNRIAIDADQGSFSLYGELDYFKNDVTFGTGFKGMIVASMKPGITVGATALFGKVSGRNYWYADAVATFEAGIPIMPPFTIYGFAGGLYYGVKQKPGDGGNIAVVNSQTGLAYLPDADAGLGIRAAVMVALQRKEVFNGNIGFEIAFHKGGGLSRVSFMGNANFMEPILDDIGGQIKTGSKAFAGTEPGSVNNTSAFDQMNKRGSLSASLLIDYDVDNQRFFADFKVYINVAGGALRGVNEGGLAGEGALYFAPDGWYLHIGTPTAPVGVELLGIAKTTSYFMAGKDLPGSPPPPPKVSEILGGQNLDYMRDLNALGKGNGIAFGAGLSFDTGDLKFLIFYAHFSAGVGFDVMLKDYGSATQCEGGGPIGINGWYANGQVYAYVQGSIGINVDLWFVKKKVNIIDLGMATVLQAKLPNPTWMHGVVGGYYSVLGGAISGHCKFEFTLGKECTIVGGEDALAKAGIEVIADVTPASNSKDVDVFTIPQAVFNLAIDKEFSLGGADGKNDYFRAKLEEYSVKDGNVPIPGTQAWNADKTVLTFNPTEVLPSKRMITVTAKISIEENQGDGWKPYVAQGKPYQEVKSSIFISGTAPDYIPLTNVAYSYPLIDQLNYYKNESNMGYIHLKRGQSYLFDPSNDFTQVGRLLSVNNDVKEFQVSYKNQQIEFTLPDISNDMGYTMSVVGVPKNTDAAIDRNVKTQETKLVSSGQSDLTLKTRKAEGSIVSVQEKTTYAMNFRASKFNSLSDKIDQATNAYSYFNPLRNTVVELGYVITTPELFDDFEINDEAHAPLIRLEAQLDDNAWYQTYILPYVYDHYPAAPQLAIDWRSPVEKMGAPPIHAVYIKYNAGVKGLKYTSGSTATPGTAAFVYNLPDYIERDYTEVQLKIANAYATGNYIRVAPVMQSIILKPFMPVRRGSYIIKASYVLPGINTVSSVKQIVINNVLGY